MEQSVSPPEIAALYAKLTPGQRDELLQCLLIAASQGGASAMMRVLTELLLCYATDEVIEDHSL